MPNNLSSIRRLRISSRNRLRNKIYKSSVKTLMKKTIDSINDININNEIKKQYLYNAYSRIDKAIKKHIIPKNQGSRKKSKLLKEYKKNTNS